MEDFVMGVTPTGAPTETVTAAKTAQKDTTMSTDEFLKLKNKYMFERNDKDGYVPGLSSGEFSSLFELAEKMKYSSDPKVAEFGRSQSNELMGMADMEEKTKYTDADRKVLAEKANEKRQIMSETMDARYKANPLARLFGFTPSEADVDVTRKEAYLASKEVYLHRDQQISPRTIEEYYRDKK